MKKLKEKVALPLMVNQRHRDLCGSDAGPQKRKARLDLSLFFPESLPRGIRDLSRDGKYIQMPRDDRGNKQPAEEDASPVMGGRESPNSHESVPRVNVSIDRWHPPWRTDTASPVSQVRPVLIQFFCLFSLPSSCPRQQLLLEEVLLAEKIAF